MIGKIISHLPKRWKTPRKSSSFTVHRTESTARIMRPIVLLKNKNKDFIKIMNLVDGFNLKIKPTIKPIIATVVRKFQ